MSFIVDQLDRSLYPEFSQNWDDSLFRACILKHIERHSIVLDLGAGAGLVTQMNFKGLVARVCGVDLDPRVMHNPMLDEARVANGAEIPFANCQFDVVFCDNVLEHLPEPLGVFVEVARVLKPGGVFLFKTPNKWHYMPTIARLTPHGFHRYVNRIRGRAEVDTFPTHYRANTKASIQRLAKSAGLTVENVKRVEGRPEYLRVSGLTYVLGAMYERLVNATDVLAPFRILLIGALRK